MKNTVNSCSLLSHPLWILPSLSFWTFLSTPRLSTWFYFLFLSLNSSFVSTTYFLPLPRIFSGDTLTFHFLSQINRFTSFVPGQSLSGYHRSCVLPGWPRPRPPITPLTLEYFISSSLFFGRVEFMQFYFIIKKKILWLFSSHSSSLHSQNYFKFMVILCSSFLPITRLHLLQTDFHSPPTAPVGLRMVRLPNPKNTFKSFCQEAFNT